MMAAASLSSVALGLVCEKWVSNRPGRWVRVKSAPIETMPDHVTRAKLRRNMTAWKEVVRVANQRSNPVSRQSQSNVRHASDRRRAWIRRFAVDDLHASLPLMLNRLKFRLRCSEDVAENERESLRLQFTTSIDFY